MSQKVVVANRKLATPEKAGEYNMKRILNGSNVEPAGAQTKIRALVFAVCVALFPVTLSSCSGSGDKNVQAGGPTLTVGVSKVVKKSLGRDITLSSELVPFQEIDVYAKEAGYVKKLLVDYGTHVKAGQIMAVLEIPELQAQLQEDQAGITNANNQVARAQHELARYQAQYKALHLQYTRLSGVFQSQPGIVAQQEVDDAQGKDLAASSQVDAGQAALEAAQSQLAAAKAKMAHDQTLYDYSKITAPFSGVVTQRYANLGTLVQAGTNSSTQALPIVKLSQDDLFRLVIPVPESYVRFIRVGDPVDVRVPSLNRTFEGKVARFSVDVREDTRTMHTEVDVRNRDHALVPGLYAEADLTLEHKEDIPTIPLQALNHEGDKTTVFVVDANNELQDRPVNVGIQTANDAEIVAGLHQGEMVVISDRAGLKAGEKVSPQIVQVMQYHENNQE
ncbi:MAG TPA: efflux RND transporter periplasmic adaptor subunit [Candidatus Sulfotelmatobacter sp.]|nr:efflux RND transporter periplasmic adaptor subunit [Candidatus Sulfotelmatobacter sp.]